MKRMYEFVCESGHRTEALEVYETAEVPCGCGGTAHRVMSAPAISLEGWSGNFPSSWMKFDQKHRDKLAAERKANA
jgi:hypothetical protein